MPLERARKRCEPQSGARRLVEHRLEKGEALVPPMAEELCVERACNERRSRSRDLKLVGARGDSRNEVAGVVAGPPKGGLAVVGSAADRERAQPVERGHVVVAIDGI